MEEIATMSDGDQATESQSVVAPYSRSRSSASGRQHGSTGGASASGGGTVHKTSGRREKHHHHKIASSVDEDSRSSSRDEDGMADNLQNNETIIRTISFTG